MTGAHEASTRLFLVGFMGSGKTTVGRLLAKAMDYGFIDLDERIEAQAGETVPRIFELWGEEGFRKRESVALEGVARESRMVVATGGGSMISEANRSLLSRAGRTVWLSPSFETVARRIAEDGVDRPLFVDAAQAEKLFHRRLAGYEAADLRVDVAPEETAAATVERVARLIRKCAT